MNLEKISLFKNIFIMEKILKKYKTFKAKLQRYKYQKLIQSQK